MTIEKTLLDRIQQNDPALTALNLNCQSLRDTDIQMLVQALASNSTLKELNLMLNEISVEGAQALASNTTLTQINLFGNQIGDKGAQALASNKTLTELDLGQNQIGDEGAQALSINTTLTKLYLMSNEIGAEGAQALAQNRGKYIQIQEEEEKLDTLLSEALRTTLQALFKEDLVELSQGYRIAWSLLSQEQAQRFETIYKAELGRLLEASAAKALPI